MKKYTIRNRTDNEGIIAAILMGKGMEYKEARKVINKLYRETIKEFVRLNEDVIAESYRHITSNFIKRLENEF